LKVRSFYDNGIKTLIEEKYYENGKKQEETFYKNNKKDGLYEAWYRDTVNDNSQLYIKCCYENNELCGPYKEYYLNGTLRKELCYKEGRKEGLCLEYYPNGNMKTKYKYLDNMPTGIIEEYDENGNKKKDTQFFFF
jgi:antitoxin component YwqK of YwqJK toxin-antitoxin module